MLKTLKKNSIDESNIYGTNNKRRNCAILVQLKAFVHID